MRVRPGLAASASLAALLALPATGLCQNPPPGGGGGGPPAGAPAAPAAPASKPQETPAAPPKEKVDTQVEVTGSRYRVKMNHGAQIEGVLSRGVYWEKLDPMTGDYEGCGEEDKGAGLRLQYVLGMEGELFVMKRDIKEIRDLGVLTEEQKRAIRDAVIADRREKIEAQDKAQRELMAKMKVKEYEESRKSEETSKGKADKKAEEEAAAAEDEKKGDALLEKFPPPDWSEKKMKELLQRKYTVGVFPNEEEKEFLDGFKLWKAALERREEAEAKESKKGDKKEEKK